jgi:hypothetical protein
MNTEQIREQVKNILKNFDACSPYCASNAVDALVGIIEDLTNLKLQ